MWKKNPHNSHQLLNSQPCSSLDADDFMLFLCRLHTLTLSSSRSVQQTCIWLHVGLWLSLSWYLRAGMWGCIPGASLVPPWWPANSPHRCHPALCQHVLSTGIEARYCFTVVFPREKCVSIILYIATSMEIVPRVLYHYSIIPLIPIVRRTYTQSIPKPQPQLHHRHKARTEAELAWPKGSSKHHLAFQSIPTVSAKQHPGVIGWRAFQRMARLAVHQQQACENYEAMESVLGVELNLRVHGLKKKRPFTKLGWTPRTTGLHDEIDWVIWGSRKPQVEKCVLSSADVCLSLVLGQQKSHPVQWIAAGSAQPINAPMAFLSVSRGV